MALLAGGPLRRPQIPPLHGALTWVLSRDGRAADPVAWRFAVGGACCIVIALVGLVNVLSGDPRPMEGLLFVVGMLVIAAADVCFCLWVYKRNRRD